MRVYIDFDDVICETARHYLVLAEKLFGVCRTYQQILFFNLQKTFDLNNENFTKLMTVAHEPEHLLAIQETTGASDIINKWVDNGHDVKIITGRPFNAYEPSRQWLDEHGLERVPLLCVNKYGREAFNQECTYNLTLQELYQMPFDFVIEDSPISFEHILHLGNCTAAVINRPWNQSAVLPNERFVRCNDWQAIDQLFEERLKSVFSSDQN